MKIEIPDDLRVEILSMEQAVGVQLRESAAHSDSLAQERSRLESEKAGLESEAVALTPKALDNAEADTRLAAVQRRISLITGRLEAIAWQVRSTRPVTMSEAAYLCGVIARFYLKEVPLKIAALLKEAEPDFQVRLRVAQQCQAVSCTRHIVSQVTMFSRDPLSLHADWALSIFRRALAGHPNLLTDPPAAAPGSPALDGVGEAELTATVPTEAQPETGVPASRAPAHAVPSHPIL